MSDWVKVLVFSASSFLILFVFAKILGKKQIAELDFTDYVVGITIGSIAAEWSTETIEPWYHFVIAMFVYTMLSLSFSLLERKSLILKKLLRGKPLLLIEDGKLNYKNLKKSKLDMYDLLSMLRVQGYFDIEQVAFAYFETGGDLSVLPKGKYKVAQVSDIVHPQITQSSLAIIVVIDGNIIMPTLLTLNKSVHWLKTRLKVKNKKDLKNIIFAQYNKTENIFDIHYKAKK